MTRLTLSLPYVPNCPSDGFSRYRGVDLPFPQQLLKSGEVAVCLTAIVGGCPVRSSDNGEKMLAHDVHLLLIAVFISIGSIAGCGRVQRVTLFSRRATVAR